jgi:hypothetical protein
MPIAGIALGTGIGGGTSATISGSPAGGGGGGAVGFNIDIHATEAVILVRAGDATGVIALATDTFNILVKSATGWQIYENS